MKKSVLTPKRQLVLVVAGLLLLHAGLLTWSAMRNSVTFDEFAHLPAGLSYWRSGKFDVYDYTPPLPRLLGSWPLLFTDVHVPAIGPYLAMPPQERHWMYGDEFLRENKDRYHQLFLLGRMALIPISCLGAWIVYQWAREIYGDVPALLPCALYVICPNILAHGSIVGTDTCTTVAMLAAAWMWSKFCREPRWRWWTLAVVAAAAAMLSKQTAILLLAMMILMPCFLLPRQPQAWRRLGLAYAGAIVAILILINVGYLFEGSFRRLDSFTFTSARMKETQALIGAVRLPLPGPLLEGIDALNGELEAGAGAYLLGEAYGGSKFYYYPVALVCKLPVATMALIAWALFSLWQFSSPRKDAMPVEKGIIWTAFFYLLFAMFLGRVNLGVRYVLPLLPLTFILTGRLWPPDERERPPALQWSVIALLGLAALESLSAAPRFLPFINIAWGGPSSGYTILNDSSFDWGQGLLDLKDWMRECNVKRVRLAYFGSVEPSVYGIDYVPLSKDSDDEYVAISSFFLTGMPQRLHTQEGVTGIAGLDFYEELQERTPVARVGWTIYIYNRSDFNAAQVTHAQRSRSIPSGSP
jgi:hypothetical protein